MNEGISGFTYNLAIVERDEEMELGHKNQQLLSESINKTFSDWSSKETVTERELYLFMRTVKETSDTIGLKELSTFCSAQLDVLSSENHNEIPVKSLKNVSNRIMSFLEGTAEEYKITVPDSYRNRFDKETFILIIDDDLEFVAYVKDLLEKMGAQVVFALDGKRGIKQFYSMRPNFVLIDLNLPDMSGFDVLDQIADVAMTRHVAVVVMDEERSMENRIQAYEKGAMDVIHKPLHLETFLPYLFNRDKRRKVIGKSIVTDGLTGVGNRKYFDEVIRRSAELSNRSGYSFTLVMVDIDKFKKVNDLYGHPAGDEVLRKLGEVVMKEKGDDEYVFRYGGEEFAFLLLRKAAETSIAFVDRVRAEFNAIVFQQKTTQFTVTFSAGIATYTGDVDKLIFSADQALYEAKRTGRNRTIIFDENKSLKKRKLHIIIVDDSRLVRTILQETLVKWTVPDIDISVQVFPDGLSFLEADWYNREEHYIVLLDGIMPEMDGLEVLNRLKHDNVEGNVLVSMMTARAGEADIKTALQLGADDYIVKPFQPEDVLERIQQLTNKLFI